MVKSPKHTENRYTWASDAKSLLEEIGEDVYKIAKRDALSRSANELHGRLSNATFKEGDKVEKKVAQLCRLEHDYHTNVTNGKSYPCRTGTGKRLSEVHNGECDENKIKGNKGNNGGGACAPFRRLNLCDRNLENINEVKKINTTHNLLLEVCLAAQYEGASIALYHPQYQRTNTYSQMCTMLTRSFADIGDIIRGKDLYHGNKEENEKLQKNLRTIFAKIYENLNAREQAHYRDDKINGNYYLLREDWWHANRREIWKAMICYAKSENKYFRQKTSEGAQCTVQNCKCLNNDPPTNLDYVPQYLRWFEEWAEDFCRLRKHKLESAIRNCRYDENDKPKYCDLNVYDCVGTAKGKDQYKYEPKCMECHSSCDRFVHWIDNQKEEFQKQKNKYTEEIEKYTNEKKETSNGNMNNLYISDFYTTLKKHYPTVDKFLEKLSKEAICKKTPEIKEEKASPVNFTQEDTNDIFSHTTYCQACPMCGLKKSQHPWEAEDEGSCQKDKIINFDDKDTSEIEIIIPDRTKPKILDKYGKLCNNNGNEEREKWKCHYNKEDKSNKCILQDDNERKANQKIEEFNSLFWRWVVRMFKDSIEWRKEHRKCIKKGKGDKCMRGCNKNCKCFQKWVQRMRTEWEKIQSHYEKEEFELWSPYGTLDLNLQMTYLEMIQEYYKGIESVREIKETIEEIIQENYGNIPNSTSEKNSINDFLKQEAQEANNCVSNNEQETCPNADSRKPGRSDTSLEDGIQTPPQDHDQHDDDHHDDDHFMKLPEVTKEVQEDFDQEEKKKAAELPPPPPPPAPPSPNVCEIVKQLFTEGDNPKETLKEACHQKYALPHRNYGWKCVTPTTTTNEAHEGGGGDRAPQRHRRQAEPGSDGGSGDSSGGAICVPPRRRKLYIQPITKWANGGSREGADRSPDGENGAGGEAAVSRDSHVGESTRAGEATAGAQTESTPVPPLLRAFIESAAVETWFLWDRYKKENTKKPEASPLANGLLTSMFSIPTDSDENQDPQTKLESGDIPPDFLRQMFYTIADYKDIFCGVNDPDVKNALQKSFIKPTSDTDKKDENILDKIDKKIREHINSLNISETPPPQKPNGNQITPSTLWCDFAHHIWNGMICALTYTEKKDDGTQIEQNKDLKEALLEEKTNKPKEDGTHNYTYKQAKLEGAVSTTALHTHDAQDADTSSDTLLSDFVKYPAFFRWLHEWGSHFCVMRTKLLDDIKHNCLKDNGRGEPKLKYSGDGEDCMEFLNGKPTIYSDLGSSCPKSCSFYRKWIKRKKDEFEKQKKAYAGQKDKCNKESAEEGNVLCTTLEKIRKTAADFLQKLGPCKKDNENNSGDDTLNFSKPNETFVPSKKCTPCSEFTVKCEKGKCPGASGEQCKYKKITAKDIKNGGNSTVLNMLVSDDSVNQFDGLEDCNDKCIFEGIRKVQWECANVCDYIVCKPQKLNGKSVIVEDDNDTKEIITIRAFIHRWLEYFLEDYNKIRKKLKPCIKEEMENRNTCIQCCDNKCNCAHKWIEEKNKEWETIRDRYLKPYEGADSDIPYDVKRFLRGLQPQTDVKKAIHPCTTLDKFQDSTHCTVTESLGNSKKRDVVLCLLGKLKKDVEKWESKTSENQNQTCENSSSSTPDNDDEEEEDPSLEAPEDKKVDHPKFCDIKDEKPAEEGGETCEETSIVTHGEGEKEEEKDKGDEEEEGEVKVISEVVKEPEPEPELEPPQDQIVSPIPAPKPKKEVAKNKPKSNPKKQPPPYDLDGPAVKTALASNALMWSVGIGFTALSYWWLLKRKPKPPVKLFSVLDIPKGDFDIPTDLSSNRYIPYGTRKHRGKRYIYIEGDSGTDSGYTDHYSDITSSSESEYEEIDMHIPHSPKYKTLIEVVLEPSKMDTQNAIPSDDTPTHEPISDDEWNELKQNFISNMLQNELKDMSNILGDNSDNNTHPTPSDNNVDQKPFIMSIHDRNLSTGEEYNYDMSNNSGTNKEGSGNLGSYGDNPNPISVTNDSYSDNLNPISVNPSSFSDNPHPYSGIDLINDALSRQPIDIYDEILKRKENELFGTENTKHMSTYSFAQPARDDPLHNQIHLFHKWLDRHRNMCQQWENNHERLDKLKKEWDKDNNKHSDIPYVLNTDVSIQIDMDNPKPINMEDTYPNNSPMDSILDDLDNKFHEPYFYDIYEDDIYYDVNDEHNTSIVNPNDMEKPSKIQIEMRVKNNKMEKDNFPIGDVWGI